MKYVIDRGRAEAPAGVTTETTGAAQSAHEQVHRRRQETAQREVEYRKEGGETEVYAEPVATGPVCHAESGRHLSGELDGRICIPGAL